MRMRPRIIALKKVVTDIPENGYDRYLYYNMNNIIGMYFVNPLLARFGIESVRDLWKSGGFPLHLHLAMSFTNRCLV